MSYSRVRSRQATLRQVASERTSGPITVGSFSRTVGQGKANVKSSILTVIIALWLGFAKSDDLRRLLDLASGGPPDIGGEVDDRVLGVIDALIERIVI